MMQLLKNKHFLMHASRVLIHALAWIFVTIIVAMFLILAPEEIPAAAAAIIQGVAQVVAH